MDGCLGCFYVLVIVPGTAVNADVQILIRIIVLLGYMPRGRVAGPHGYFVLSSLNFPNNPIKLLFHTHYKDEEIDYWRNLKISPRKCRKSSRAD